MGDVPLGRLLLVRRNTMQDGSGSWENVCGLRDRNFGGESSEIDSTRPSCDTPEGALVKTVRPGMQSRGFQGSGLFEDEARMKSVADDWRLQRAWYYQIVVPGYGDFTGPHYVMQMQWNGDMEGDLGYSLSIQPQIPATFTAEA